MKKECCPWGYSELDNDEDFQNMVAESISDELSLFALAYFGKTLGELTPDEDHIIDCFGMFGVSEWLIDHPNEEAEAELKLEALKSKKT